MCWIYLARAVPPGPSAALGHVLSLGRWRHKQHAHPQQVELQAVQTASDADAECSTALATAVMTLARHPRKACKPDWGAPVPQSHNEAAIAPSSHRADQH